jgi:DNA-binding transcriptional LysR family regulator
MVVDRDGERRSHVFPQGYLRSMHNENWDDLRYVLAVAEGGSVSAAAKSLGVNHATVLRRIAAFETRHGALVFDRGPAAMPVRPDQRRLIEAAREVEAGFGALDRLAHGSTALSGVIRVTSTDSFTAHVLPRIVARLEAPRKRRCGSSF